MYSNPFSVCQTFFMETPFIMNIFMKAYGVDYKIICLLKVTD